jgi:hypothetical protein
MTILIFILIQLADVISGHLSGFFTSVSNIAGLPTAGETVALAAIAITYSSLPAEMLAAARRWHGSIDEQFVNINNLIVTIQANQATWGTPPQFSQLVANRKQLITLIPKCRSLDGSTNDRTQRNTLLKTSVGICLTSVKLWAYGKYNTNPNTFTLDNLHSLGFLLPGEAGGVRIRAKATEVAAEIKVTALSADMIRAVIDQASTDNAALVAHGWPPGVKTALIVILAADNKTEIIRLHTTHLYNEIRMPEGSHGKAFVAKAAFLKHIDDEPVFGPQPTFTMPYSTEDLLETLDRQHYEEYENSMREIERHRQELQHLSQPGTQPDAK